LWEGAPGLGVDDRRVFIVATVLRQRSHALKLPLKGRLACERRGSSVAAIDHALSRCQRSQKSPLKALICCNY